MIKTRQELEAAFPGVPGVFKDLEELWRTTGYEIVRPIHHAFFWGGKSEVLFTAFLEPGPGREAADVVADALKVYCEARGPAVLCLACEAWVTTTGPAGTRREEYLMVNVLVAGNKMFLYRRQILRPPGAPHPELGPLEVEDEAANNGPGTRYYGFNLREGPERYLN